MLKLDKLKFSQWKNVRRIILKKYTYLFYIYMKKIMTRSCILINLIIYKTYFFKNRNFLKK
ncbi:hypothetical protein BJP41_09225 [Candidatus Williamhamiltonella defendens]|uniref:Uncharacterized protein n=1 Tax=Candidatus Williamhamiltonella defendens TaxID=138072 RepID=A0A2D3T3V3_9ENTR|nr:hypothetical protein CJJ18_09530 [Candidatus Hamiltonella defensa]ATW30475.1 hypothetical protein BJP41_09225 [Candidatus Hamiltonella defensa]ATW32486.1 hypothetical protein BJP42_09535 [Candidatus Hamiltonella defensa]ATW34239.1 hypothetical protein BJP43_08205 [Candidatus Hamiltonella defensa]AWK17107.1 hypothetical protein CCS40_09355 [Candidatus Hamiltonella defensa]